MSGFDNRTGAGDANADTVACPFCGSADTRVAQRKGTAMCRKMFVCRDCKQPFEQFD